MTTFDILTIFPIGSPTFLQLCFLAENLTVHAFLPVCCTIDILLIGWLLLRLFLGGNLSRVGLGWGCWWWLGWLHNGALSPLGLSHTGHTAAVARGCNWLNCTRSRGSRGSKRATILCADPCKVYSLNTIQIRPSPRSLHCVHNECYPLRGLMPAERQ